MGSRGPLPVVPKARSARRRVQGRALAFLNFLQGPHVRSVPPGGLGRASSRPQRRAHRPARRRQNHAGAASPCSRRRGSATGSIVMLEPRRLATRAAASRMAALRGEAVGGTVGYRTRLDSAVSAATRIEVVTEGLLVRRLQSDPGLEGVACVILDEVHERALEADLALAFCLDLQRQLRPELRLLAMSATADGARLGPLLDAVVIESAGRAAPGGGRARGARHRRAARPAGGAGPRGAGGAGGACRRRAGLPARHGRNPPRPGGAGRLRRAGAAAARRPAARRAGSRPAPGRGPAGGAGHLDRRDLADRARRAHRRRWRLAAGAAARPRHRADPPGHPPHQPRRRRTSAPAGPGARGRGWRSGCGPRRCIAACRSSTGRRSCEAELSGLLLDCAAWGTAPADLPFPDPPPAGPLAAAAALLDDLGALDPGPHHRTRPGDGAAGRASAPGRHDAGRRHARAGGAGGRPRRPAGGARPAAQCRGVLRHRAAAGGPGGRRGGGRSRRGRPHPPRRRPVPPPPARAGRGRRATRRRCWPPPSPTGSPSGAASRAVSACPAAAGRSCRWPTRCRRRSCWRSAPLDAKGSARIRLAAPLDPASLPAAVAARITETVESGFDPASGAVLSRRRRRLGALVLEDRTEPADPADVAAAWPAPCRWPRCPGPTPPASCRRGWR